MTEWDWASSHTVDLIYCKNEEDYQSWIKLRKQALEEARVKAREYAAKISIKDGYHLHQYPGGRLGIALRLGLLRKLFPPVLGLGGGIIIVLDVFAKTEFPGLEIFAREDWRVFFAGVLVLIGGSIWTIWDDKSWK